MFPWLYIHHLKGWWPISDPASFGITPKKFNFRHSFFPPFFFRAPKNTCWGALIPWILCVGEVSMPSTCGTTKSLRFRAVHQGVNNVVMIRLSWLVDLNWVNNQPRKEDKEHGVVIVLKQHVKGDVVLFCFALVKLVAVLLLKSSQRLPKKPTLGCES